MFGADCEDVPSANATPLAIPSDKTPASATLAPVDNSFPEAIILTQPFVYKRSNVCLNTIATSAHDCSVIFNHR